MRETAVLNALRELINEPQPLGIDRPAYQQAIAAVEAYERVDSTAASAVERAARIVGNKSKLARSINVAPQTLQDWASGFKAVPVRRCVQIEQATNGAVTRRDLRPHDWKELWPELATQTQEVPA